jgi:hypothetical protein
MDCGMDNQLQTSRNFSKCQNSSSIKGFESLKLLEFQLIVANMCTILIFDLQNFQLNLTLPSLIWTLSCIISIQGSCKCCLSHGTDNECYLNMIAVRRKCIRTLYYGSSLAVNHKKRKTKESRIKGLITPFG